MLKSLGKPDGFLRRTFTKKDKEYDAEDGNGRGQPSPDASRSPSNDSTQRSKPETGRGADKRKEVARTFSRRPKMEKLKSTALSPSDDGVNASSVLLSDSSGSPADTENSATGPKQSEISEGTPAKERPGASFILKRKGKSDKQLPVPETPKSAPIPLDTRPKVDRHVVLQEPPKAESFSFEPSPGKPGTDGGIMRETDEYGARRQESRFRKLKSRSESIKAMSPRIHGRRHSNMQGEEKKPGMSGGNSKAGEEKREVKKALNTVHDGISPMSQAGGPDSQPSSPAFGSGTPLSRELSRQGSQMFHSQPSSSRELNRQGSSVFARLLSNRDGDGGASFARENSGMHFGRQPSRASGLSRSTSIRPEEKETDQTLASVGTELKDLKRQWSTRSDVQIKMPESWNGHKLAEQAWEEDGEPLVELERKASEALASKLEPGSDSEAPKPKEVVKFPEFALAATSSAVDASQPSSRHGVDDSGMSLTREASTVKSKTSRKGTATTKGPVRMPEAWIGLDEAPSTWDSSTEAVLAARSRLPCFDDDDEGEQSQATERTSKKPDSTVNRDTSTGAPSAEPNEPGLLFIGEASWIKNAGSSAERRSSAQSAGTSASDDKPSRSQQDNGESERNVSNEGKTVATGEGTCTETSGDENTDDDFENHAMFGKRDDRGLFKQYSIPAESIMNSEDAKEMDPSSAALGDSTDRPMVELADNAVEPARDSEKAVSPDQVVLEEAEVPKHASAAQVISPTGIQAAFE